MESELKFEKALERLEKIVEDLESGNLALDEALKRYEEGVKLSRLCSQRLVQAENKIEVLTKALNGALDAVPFSSESSVKGVERKKAKKREGNSETSDDLLL